MNKQIIFYVVSFGLTLTGQLYNMRSDCPIKLSEQERKDILQNREYFIEQLGKTTNIGDKNEAPYDLRCTDLQNLPIGQRWLINLDLSGAMLDNAQHFNGVLQLIDLSDASLKNIDLSRTQMWDCTLDRANFTGASLAGCNLIGETEPISAKNANFTGANISATAAITNINLQGAIFDDALLSNADLNKFTIDDTTSFKKTNLQMSQLTGWTGQTGDLKNFLLKQRTKLAGASIDGTDTDMSFGS